MYCEKMRSEIKSGGCLLSGMRLQSRRMIPLSGWGETAGSLIGNTYRIRLMTGRSGQYSEKPQEQPYSRHQAVSSGGAAVYTVSPGGHNQQASWQHQQQSRQPERRYHPDERVPGGDLIRSNEQGSKDKLLYAFLGIITVILVIGIIWGVATLMDLNDEEDTTVETKEASAEEINPDLESETEEAE